MFLASAFVMAALTAFIFLSLWNSTAAIFGLCAALTGALFYKVITTPGNDPDEIDEGDALSSAEASAEDASVEWRRVPSPSALLDATMNSMRAGVLMVNDAMKVIASNRAARDIFMTVAGGIEVRLLSEVTRNPVIHNAFRAAIERGERAEVKVEVNGRDRRTFDLRVAPLRSHVAGERQVALGIFFDITRLERLERVRQEFLSNVSHELRTPLTAILAFVETLEEGAIDDRENNRRFLSVIRKNATRMHNLIDDILELSAIEAGTVSVLPERVRLHPLIEDVTTALAARARERHITLRNEVGAEAFVYAEARRLEQMLTNLVDNAIKFNREGGTVIINYEEGADASCDRIRVEDTGEGISVEHLPRIFERFYRVDRARTSREVAGTGLGLAIVKHLARAHGGEASVQSTVGTGTTFTIELPKSNAEVRMQNDE